MFKITRIYKYNETKMENKLTGVFGCYNEQLFREL